MSVNKNIIIVSGLPRSGTSMMMQILQAGGIDLVVDKKRPADLHNPYGYFEFEKVKNLEQDNSWITDCHGKAIKILFHLLQFLPEEISYKILFMMRDLDDVINSQNKMLQSYNSNLQNNDKIRSIFENEIIQTKQWLKNQRNMDGLFVNYDEVIENRVKSILRISDFLDRKLNRQKMISVINPV